MQFAQVLRFSLFDPFTYTHADQLTGHHVEVEVFDSGLTHIYCGQVAAVSRGRIKIGEDILLNDCVVGVKVLSPEAAREKELEARLRVLVASVALNLTAKSSLVGRLFDAWCTEVGDGGPLAAFNVFDGGTITATLVGTDGTAGRTYSFHVSVN